MTKSKLPKAFTEKCAACKHGKGAHKLWNALAQLVPELALGVCRMKHCKCSAFKAAQS